MASLLISVTTDFADLKCFNKEIEIAPVPVPNSKIFLIQIFCWTNTSIKTSLSILGEKVCSLIDSFISLK